MTENATLYTMPNILWICADDFTPDACSAYGNNLIRTPALDHLASQGIRFDRAYCTCPLSTPSRQSFWTGRYPRSIGVTLSTTRLPKDEITLPTILKHNGYAIAAFGKTHYYWPRRHEFDVCCDWEEYQHWLTCKPPVALPANIKTLGKWRPFFDPARIWLNSDCLPYPAVDTDMYGTFLTTQAIKYLAQKQTQPFFLYLSYYETHSPFNFPIEYSGRYDPRSFNVPLVTIEDIKCIPKVFRDLTESDKQGILAAYATSAEFMDKNVGMILNALDQSEYANNTLVIFTSDHGYLLGQHGRFEKHCCFEPAVRTALLMRFPTLIHSGQSTSALVELIDLMPTVLEWCGIDTPKNVQGRSLIPLLTQQTNLHREYVIAEYADNEEIMIRTERWKLIYSTGTRQRLDGYYIDIPTTPWLQLYDLMNDPNELVNLAGQNEYASLLEHLINKIIEHLIRTDRNPQSIPQSQDIKTILAHCLAPKDGFN